MKVRLRWIVGTPPRPLELPPVEKRARMAERGHAAVAAASRFSGTLPCALRAYPSSVNTQHWFAQLGFVNVNFGS